MPVKKIKYQSLEKLIRQNLVLEEDLKTAELIKLLKPVRKRGWLNKDELIEICYWKSARAIWLIESNHPNTIKSISKSALKNRKEEIMLAELIKLKGVGIPMASAILMLINPKRYGVIDVRVWEMLHATGVVNTNPTGLNFKISEWSLVQSHLRSYSKSFGVSVRDIERTIFELHRKYQEGNLYNIKPVIQSSSN